MDVRIVVQFAIATILPAALTACLTLLRKGRASRIPDWPWQAFCGVAFGMVAIFGTEFGIAVEGATMNVRDAAPIAAGLFFGAPAGILAGIIGGVERWFAALWGRGMFTRVACSVATCAAGVYAALLHVYVFEGRKPSWPLACFTGIVAEVLHLLLAFLTNINDATRAFLVVRACTVPMISCNGIAVALVAVVAAMMAGEWSKNRSEVPGITQTVQVNLLRVVVIGFVISAALTSLIQSNLSHAKTDNLLSTALLDVRNDIAKASDDNLLALTRRVGFAIPYTRVATREKIDQLVKELEVSEIDVIDANGIIVASNLDELLGYDMASGEQSAEFLALLPGGTTAQMTQSYQPRSYDGTAWRKYAGVRIKDGFVQVAYDAARFMDDLSEHVASSVSNRHVGQEGFLVVINPDGKTAETRSDIRLNETDVAALRSLVQSIPTNTVATTQVLGGSCYVLYTNVEGYQLFALQPVVEAQLERDESVLMMAFMEVIVFAMVFIAVYRFVRHEVVQSIWQVNGTLGQITNGDLQAEVAVRSNAEFISLSEDINVMVASLRNAIAAEASRIDRELGYARAIQENALPRTFPPFPDINAFDIYASMNAAREVGGDFYDFFLIDDHTLGFLIADVSGKGIPASLFMMAAKAELSNYMSSGMGLSDAVQTANWHLCQGNDADMFVTVWAATLDYKTGLLTYVNAGHNPPLLRHEGKWVWLRDRGGLFLGTFEMARYQSNKLQLSVGDELFLYTDGVSEAFSADLRQYGDERIERFLVSRGALHPRPLIESMRADLARWASGTEQSDDITMLALEYGVSPQATGTLTIPATLDQLDVVFDFIHDALRDRSCPLSTQNQIDVALEELFVNVCNYAYRDAGEPGTATIEYIYNANPNSLTVAISDYGVPFDPLDHADPLTPKSIDEAKIGGLGILMVKRMTDDLSYVRDGNQNVVAFVKSW